MNRVHVFLAVIVLLLGLSSVGAKTQTETNPEKLKPGAYRAANGAAVTNYAVLDGSILGMATPADRTGRRSLLILVVPAPKEKREFPLPCPPVPEKPEDRTVQLVRFDPSGNGRLDTLRNDLPRSIGSIIPVDWDGDGEEELLLTSGDRVEMLKAGGDRRWSGLRKTLLEAKPAWTGVPQLWAAKNGTIGLWAVVPGTFQFFVRDQEKARWLQRAELPLPVYTGVWRAHLYRNSPTVSPLGPLKEDQLLFVTPLERQDPQRYSVQVRDPLAPGGPRGFESWFRFPGPERVLNQAFLNFDGQPLTFAATTSAEKLKVFKEQDARLFNLSPDRTRSGRPPMAAFETGANLWQHLFPKAVDIDWDGRQDLVLGYWKGLRKDTLVLEVHRRLADGGFDPDGIDTSFSTEGADRSFLEYGHDLDQDGHPDLLILKTSGVAFYRGLPSQNGKELVAEVPAWVAPLAAEWWFTSGVTVVMNGGELNVEADDSHVETRFVDFDHDGRIEPVIWANDRIMVIHPPQTGS